MIHDETRLEPVEERIDEPVGEEPEIFAFRIPGGRGRVVTRLADVVVLLGLAVPDADLAEERWQREVVSQIATVRRPRVAGDLPFALVEDHRLAGDGVRHTELILLIAPRELVPSGDQATP